MLTQQPVRFLVCVAIILLMTPGVRAPAGLGCYRRYCRCRRLQLGLLWLWAVLLWGLLLRLLPVAGVLRLCLGRLLLLLCLLLLLLLLLLRLLLLLLLLLWLLWLWWLLLL